MGKGTLNYQSRICWTVGWVNARKGAVPSTHWSSSKNTVSQRRAVKTIKEWIQKNKCARGWVTAECAKGQSSITNAQRWSLTRDGRYQTMVFSQEPRTWKTRFTKDPLCAACMHLKSLKTTEEAYFLRNRWPPKSITTWNLLAMGLRVAKTTGSAEILGGLPGGSLPFLEYKWEAIIWE